jgi:serine/threonine-protein kinase
VAGTIASGKLLKDRYRLESTLGRGGMAAVWLGHDEVLDRPVAVKVLSDTIATDPGFVARFRREARTAAGLSHPNLVGVYDFSEAGERPYLVMQFVPGEDLASRLRREEALDVDRLARELLDALSHIHEVGILHRDIKPANIVIEPGGTAKLIDFGIALPRDATSLTKTGLVLGSERFAAPEVMEGRPATERSDLYSCGVVLRSCSGDRSQRLEALVAAMADKDPRSRPRSAAQALAELRAPGPDMERPTVPHPFPTTATHRLGGGRSRREVIAVALGILAVLTVFGVVAFGGDDRGPGDSDKRTAQAKDVTARGKGGGPQAARSESAAPPADPGRGAALNEQGYRMVQAGEYAAAVPVLEEAVASFPKGTDDVNYAYALFNLGNALRLGGRPGDAIPILERRLKIPNQEGAVRQELEAAYAEAGEPTPSEGDG